MSAIESLKKITYENLEQFQDDINRNFAVIENSPLYKGIPGTEGDDGQQGLRGIRGIKFLFVNYTKFNEQFPGELSVPSKIDLNFINSKVSNFETRQKLFTALGVTEFVDKDVVVLTNSAMMSYDGVNEFFFDTLMAFNPESNLLSNINTIIENYVKYYIDNNPILNGLVNIFQIYQTYAKNYADNNSTFITTELTESSVYSPYIPGFNSTIGIKILNHKYFGYNDVEFPISNNGTFVFGSMKRYYQLLMNTISTAGNETLSSDYAPGAGNIPTAVFLQDTYKNGIYIGHKDKTNLKRFGIIYKNENNDMVIKSDSSMIESEFSELLINRSYMQFKKLVQFFDSLEVSRDLTVFSDINNKHIRTGKFTDGAVVGNGYNQNKAEFGASGAGTIKINASEFDEYVHYLDRVLVTNQAGRVMKEYAIEKIAMNNQQLVDLNQITGFPTNQYNVLTSNYFGFLATKINNVTTYAATNYWRKNQFNTGDIPDLTLSNNLTVKNNASLGDGLVTVNKNNSLTEIKTVTTNLDSATVRATEFKSKVLVTDAGGYISKLYSLETTTPDITYNATTGALVVQPLPNADKEILTSTYFNYLATLINSTNNFTVANYWRKNQFETGEIPGIRLSTSLLTDGIVNFNNSHGSHFLLQKSTDSSQTQLTLGNNNDANPTFIALRSQRIQFNKFTNKILVTDNQGNVLNQYLIATGDITITQNTLTNGGVTYTVPLLNVPTTNDDNNSLPVWKHLKAVASFAAGLTSWVQTNFWRKDQYNTGEIPNMKIGNVLKALGNVAFGPETAPNISTNGTQTNIGKANGETNINGVIKTINYQNAILTTGPDGTVSGQYSVDTSVPSFTNPTAPVGSDPWFIDTIRANYWVKGLVQNLGTYPIDEKKIPHSRHWDFLITNIAIIKEMLYNRPTFAEVEGLGGLPKGSIILWTNTLGGIPDGFVICDGRLVPGTSINTPNLNGRYAKGALIPNVFSGNVNNTVPLVMSNIPSHKHTGVADSGGAHYHTLVGEGGNQTGLTGSNYFKRQYSSGGNMGYDINGTNSSPLLGRSSSVGDHSHNVNIGYAGSVSPTPVSIEPASLSVIYLMKYTGNDTGAVVPANHYTINSYDPVAGNLFFTKNGGTDSGCAIQILYPQAQTWQAFSGDITSPRTMRKYLPAGAKIRIQSLNDPTNYSNVLNVNSFTEPPASTAAVTGIAISSYTPSLRLLDFFTVGGNETKLIMRMRLYGTQDAYQGYYIYNYPPFSIADYFSSFPTGAMLEIRIDSVLNPNVRSSTITFNAP